MAGPEIASEYIDPPVSFDPGLYLVYLLGEGFGG
jgi:hypothetical protein